MNTAGEIEVGYNDKGDMILNPGPKKRNTKSYKTELKLEIGRKKLWVKRFKWVLMVALVELMVILMWL